DGKARQHQGVQSEQGHWKPPAIERGWAEGLVGSSGSDGLVRVCRLPHCFSLANDVGPADAALTLVPGRCRFVTVLPSFFFRMTVAVFHAEERVPSENSPGYE